MYTGLRSCQIASTSFKCCSTVAHVYCSECTALYIRVFLEASDLFTLECLTDDLHGLLLKSELKHKANNGLKILHVIRVVWSIRRFI